MILGYIFLILLGLGFFIMIIGLLGAGMFMFGFKKTQRGGKSKLIFKAFGIDFAIETGSSFFAIAIGLIMIISSPVINELVPHGAVAPVIAEDENIPVTTELRKEQYTIDREDIMIDLRKRKEIGLLEYYAGDLSETTWRIQRTIKEVGDDVEEMHFTHATSGAYIRPIKPEGAMWPKWRKLKEKSKEMRNPFFDLLKGQGLQKILDDLFQRKGTMKTYYLTVPKIEGEGQQILYQLKYFNAFQGRDFEWAGKVFSADTDVLTMKIAFPEKKPFKSYEAYKKAAGTEEMNRIENPDIKTEGNEALAWTIRDAKEGEKYFIKWTW